jgi:hypothetical protein
VAGSPDAWTCWVFIKTEELLWRATGLKKTIVPAELGAL